jgi:hypothetical protein
MLKTIPAHYSARLNLSHCKIVEAVRLKIIASNSITTCLPNIMKIYQSVQKVLAGDTVADTDRQTDWWFDKPT